MARGEQSIMLTVDLGGGAVEQGEEAASAQPQHIDAAAAAAVSGPAPPPLLAPSHSRCHTSAQAAAQVQAARLLLARWLLLQQQRGPHAGSMPAMYLASQSPGLDPIAQLGQAHMGQTPRGAAVEGRGMQGGVRGVLAKPVGFRPPAGARGRSSWSAGAGGWWSAALATHL